MKTSFFLLLAFITLVAAKEFHFDLKNSRSKFLNDFLKPKNLKFSPDQTPYPDMCEKRINPLSPNYYYFFPVVKGKLYKVGDKVEFKSGCFKKNSATISSILSGTMTITLNVDEPEDLLCSDIYLFHTPGINQLATIFTRGEHKIVIENMIPDDLDEIKLNSIKIFGFCQAITEVISSFEMTLELYWGGLGDDPEDPDPLYRPTVPEDMAEANVKMVEFYNHYTIRKRDDILVDLDEKEIHTGDFVAISRMDGVDNMIMIGTGSTIGHSAVAAWIDEKLYVIESQDGWYWPKHGIQRNEWKQWVKWAHNADFNVAIIPLSPESYEKFDTKKAIEWFTNGIEGLNYGYHNFLFSFIDTPDSNLPWVLGHEHFEFIFTILEGYAPDLATKMLGEGVNMRLGTKNLTLAQASAVAARRGIKFEELLAIPEKEGWEYSDGKNYVCSCFVVAFYKAGGLFDDLEINSTEFTPKDLYQLDFFDKNYQKPKVCQEADPELPYCQIMGKYKIDLPGYSTIKPYAHMNEKCPSMAPDFFRPAHC